MARATLSALVAVALLGFARGASAAEGDRCPVAAVGQSCSDGRTCVLALCIPEPEANAGCSGNWDAGAFVGSSPDGGCFACAVCSGLAFSVFGPYCPPPRTGLDLPCGDGGACADQGTQNESFFDAGVFDGGAGWVQIPLGACVTGAVPVDDAGVSADSGPDGGGASGGGGGGCGCRVVPIGDGNGSAALLGAAVLIALRRRSPRARAGGATSSPTRRHGSS